MSETAEGLSGLLTQDLQELHFNSLIKVQLIGPGWRGAIQILSTVPTVDWVLLGSGESNKG